MDPAVALHPLSYVVYIYTYIIYIYIHMKTIYMQKNWARRGPLNWNGNDVSDLRDQTDGQSLVGLWDTKCDACDLAAVLMEVFDFVRFLPLSYCFRQLWNCFETYLNQILCFGAKSRQFTHFNHTKKIRETASRKKRTLRGVGTLSRSLDSFAFRLFRHISLRVKRRRLYLNGATIPDVDLATDARE